MIQIETNTRVIRTKDKDIFETMVTTLRNSGYHINKCGIELLESPHLKDMEDTLNKVIHEESPVKESVAGLLSFIPQMIDQGSKKDWYWWAILTKKSMFRGK